MKWFAVLITTMLALTTGCKDQDKSPGQPDPVDRSFNGFVIDLIENKTSNSSDPLDINDRTLTNIDNDDGSQYDALF